MSFQMRDVDRGYARVLTNVRSLAGGRAMRVGVTDAPHEGSPGMSVADIGAIHEFGLGTAPQRSFLRAFVDTQPWLARLRAGVLAFVMRGTAWEKEFGEYCVEGVRKRIRDEIPPPVLPETERRKTRLGQPSTPLVATNQLIDGVIYEAGPR